jgi:Ca2+-binding RTX toxin-like protein
LAARQGTVAGTVQADLVLDIDPAADTPFCRRGTDDVWEPVPGGGLDLRVEDGAWVDYCSLFDDDRSLPIGRGIGPNTELDLHVDVRLRPGTDDRYSDVEDSDQLTVRAHESGNPAGFSDHVVGSIQISTGSIRPGIPQHCIDAGLTDFDEDNTVYLTEGNDTYVTGKQPVGGRGFLVFGFAGNDHIVGSNQGDCIDGGAGDDELWGMNQSDVVIGGQGDDVLNSPEGIDGDLAKSNGTDLLYGGDGDDLIYGGNAKDSLSGDSLFGEAGDDTLVGGRGTDIVDGGAEVTRDVCIDASGDGADSTEQFLDCESVVRALDDTALADLIAMAEQPTSATDGTGSP